jgi:hypothetical protein
MALFGISYFIFNLQASFSCQTETPFIYNMKTSVLRQIWYASGSEVVVFSLGKTRKVFAKLSKLSLVHVLKDSDRKKDPAVISTDTNWTSLDQH